MSKKGKKEETEVKSVNTGVDEDNAYYNYEESSATETKKPGLFKRLFRGKKKVTTSNELNAPQEEDFYQGMVYEGTEEQQPVQNEMPVQSQPVNNNPPIQNNPPVQNKVPIPVNNYNSNKNEGFTNQNNNFQNVNNEQQYTGPMDYYYQPPVQEVQEEEKPVIPKKIGYVVAFCVLAAAIVIVVLNLMSSASEKYYIDVSTSSITLRPYEGAQITFLTNNTKKTSFSSSDDSIVTVTEYGYIKGTAYKRNDDGYNKATITVGNNNTKTYKTIDVYIVPSSTSIPIEDFTVPESVEVKVGEKKLIEITNIVPPNTTRQTFDYIVQDKSIAEVDGVGIINGKRRGTTTIEVRNHITKTVTKTVTVTVK